MVASMLKNERSKQILEQLLRDGEVTVLQLAERLSVSLCGSAAFRAERLGLSESGFYSLRLRL